MSELATPEDRQRNGRALVTSTALAGHFGVSQPYISKLMAEGVIERLPGGRFDQDVCRLAYLRWLRDPARRSARTQADADYVKVKTEMLRLRLLEKRRELVPVADLKELIDTFVGLVLTKLGGLPARVAGTDLGARRKAEAVVIELRREIATACNEMADQCGEPDEP